MKCLVCGFECETNGRYCYYCGSLMVGDSNTEDWNTAEGRVDGFATTLRIAKAGCYALSEKNVTFSREPEEYERAIYIKGDEVAALSLKRSSNTDRGFEVRVVCADSFEAVEKVARDAHGAADAKPPLVLNFANPHFPGGGVVKGAKAQEEDLCRRSTLYLSLTSDDAAAFYAANKATSDYVFTDDMILSPCVSVFRDVDGALLREPFEVAVLTMPAPYAKGMSDSERRGLAEIIEKRIEIMLRAAALHGYDRLILGAWGCGAFGNDPEVVAYAFYKAIDRMKRCGQSGFRQIIFAIPDKGSVNYEAFMYRMQGLQFEKLLVEKKRSDLNSAPEKDASNQLSQNNLKRFEFDLNDCYLVDPGPRLEVTVTDDIDIGDVVELKLTGDIVKIKTKNHEKNGLFEFTGIDSRDGKELLFDRENIERKIKDHGLRPGDVLGERYQILGEIGRGGIAHVFFARDLKLLGKYLAIREIEKKEVGPARLTKRFIDKEAYLLSKLDHPNIVAIHDTIETNDYSYIVLDYVEGQLLSELLEEEGPQGEGSVLDWMLQLCDALRYLHMQDPPIIHRNVKPNSIMLRPDGRVTLISFGVAREYKEGQTYDTIACVTVGFAAPEAYGKGQTDARSDIYSLGVTMWKLLTGEAPPRDFPLPDVRGYMPKDAPRVSDAVADIIIPKCTAMDGADRYQSCEELAYDLRHVDELNRMIEKHRHGFFGRFRRNK